MIRRFLDITRKLKKVLIISHRSERAEKCLRLNLETLDTKRKTLIPQSCNIEKSIVVSREHSFFLNCLISNP